MPDSVVGTGSRQSVVSQSVAAGRMVHAWIPALDGQSASESEPSGICLTFNTVGRCTVLTAGRRDKRDVTAGCISIAGRDPIQWLRTAMPADLVEVTAGSEVRREIAESMGVSSKADLADLHGGTDCVVWAIAVQIRSLLRTSGALPPLIGAKLVYDLYAHIFAARFGGRLPVKGEGKLSQRRLGRVIAYIDEHLRERVVNLEALAAVASLSPFHFLRSFKRTVYMTPHAFVRARRLECAKADLIRGDLPTEVARRYGFNHPRHFRAAYALQHGGVPRVAG